MKRGLCICIALLLCMLTACGSQESQTNTQASSSQEVPLAETRNDSSESAPAESEPAESGETDRRISGMPSGCFILRKGWLSQ